MILSVQKKGLFRVWTELQQELKFLYLDFRVLRLKMVLRQLVVMGISIWTIHLNSILVFGLLVCMIGSLYLQSIPNTWREYILMPWGVFAVEFLIILSVLQMLLF